MEGVEEPLIVAIAELSEQELRDTLRRRDAPALCEVEALALLLRAAGCRRTIRHEPGLSDEERSRLASLVVWPSRAVEAASVAAARAALESRAVAG